MPSHFIRALTTLLITSAVLLVGTIAPQQPQASVLAAPAGVQPKARSLAAPVGAPSLAFADTPTAQTLLRETEPNNTLAQAAPIAPARRSSAATSIPRSMLTCSPSPFRPATASSRRP